MKARQIRDFSEAELSKKISELKSELFNLKFQNATNQLDNPMRIVSVKKDIARAMTILFEKQNQGKE